MSLHKKVFLSLAISIVGISFVFIILTHFTVKSSIETGIKETRGQEISKINKELTRYFLENNQTWNNVQQLKILQMVNQENPEILVLDSEDQVIFKIGNSPNKLIRYLGINSELKINKVKIGQFFYYDPEIANFNKIMIGIPISVLILLISSGSLFIILALLAAYRLSNWIAAPIRKLLPIIDRLGKGELGIQIPVGTNDEYGRIADAFNQMSKKLEHAEIVRRNLTADIAHELRTPLTIVSGKLEELQHQGKMIKPEILLPLQDELIRLNKLVEDLRMLSLAEAGKLKLNKTPTIMLDIANQIIEVIEPIAEEKNIKLQIDSKTNDVTVSVDPNRIKQVFLNLLTNAIQYTPDHGNVYVHILKEDGDFLKVIVEDTGIGIESEHLPHLFDRFYRADDARSRYNGGTGLGLAIAKQYVLSHGGKIDVVSTLNKGTSFIIHLPY